MLNSACAQAELLQFLLDGVIPSRFSSDFRSLVSLNLERGGHHGPPLLAPMDFKAVFDQLSALLLGAHDWDEYPLIVYESLQRLDFAVGNRDHFGMIVNGLRPRLLTHEEASVVE